MSYPLAKELKDAGFPQMGEGSALILHNPDRFDEIEDQSMSRISWERYVFTKPEERNRYGEDVYEPTLSELIQECGDIKLVIGGTLCNATKGEVSKNGRVPEEAVGRLWLATHKSV